MSALSVCIGCASGVAYTRVSGALTSCPMFLHTQPMLNGL